MDVTNLPPFMQSVLLLAQTPAEKDMLLLASLTACGAVMPNLLTPSRFYSPSFPMSLSPKPLSQRPPRKVSLPEPQRGEMTNSSKPDLCRKLGTVSIKKLHDKLDQVDKLPSWSSLSTWSCRF